MSLTKEIIEIEQSRSDVQSRCSVHLFKEGSFLRAYNWSAWLCCRYLHEFKVNKRKFKNFEEPITFIGFPETSLTKWVPDNCEPVIEDDKHYVLQLALDISDSSEEDMQKLYKEWNDSIAVVEAQKRNDEQNIIKETPGPTTLSSIVQQIAAFPVESKSPIDCMLFIAELKKEISKII